MRNYLEKWIKGLQIFDFQGLKELIVTDQIKRKLPIEIQEHFIDDLPKIKNADAIVNKLDNYEALRQNINQINKNLYRLKDRRPTMHEHGNSKLFLTINAMGIAKTAKLVCSVKTTQDNPSYHCQYACCEIK